MFLDVFQLVMNCNHLIRQQCKSYLLLCLSILFFSSLLSSNLHPGQIQETQLCASSIFVTRSLSLSLFFLFFSPFALFDCVLDDMSSNVPVTRVTRDDKNETPSKRKKTFHVNMQWIVVKVKVSPLVFVTVTLSADSSEQLQRLIRLFEWEWWRKHHTHTLIQWKWKWTYFVSWEGKKVRENNSLTLFMSPKEETC